MSFQRFQRMQRDCDSRFHVQNPWSVSQTAFDTKWTLLDCACGPNRVHVAKEQQLVIAFSQFGYKMITHHRLVYHLNPCPNIL